MDRKNGCLKESEEQFKFALDSAKMGLWTVDLPEGKVHLSDEAAEIFGFAKTYGDTNAAIDEFIHPDHRDQARKVLAEAIMSGALYNDEYKIIKPGGEVRWINARGRARYDAKGNPYELAGLIWDVTDRKSAEIDLKDLQARFQKSAEATDLGVWYCDLPFDELIWNKEVKNHFFLPPDAKVTIGLFYQRIHPEDREKTKHAIDVSIKSHRPYDTIYRTVDPKNPSNMNFIRAVGWTDYNEKNEPIRFDGITLDVTSDFHRNQELSAAKEEAEKANQIKSAFLANMSHEIRTPLGAIMGFVDLMKQPNLDREDLDNYISIISRNSDQLLRIIDDILDLSKVEAGMVQVEHMSFSLPALLSDFSSLMDVRAKDKSIHFQTSSTTKIPDEIISDPMRLKQILSNIVGNALKFTDIGHVHLAVSYEKPFLYFRVEDTGPGMSKLEQEKIFQPFSQADISTTRKFGGTGLGLVLTKKLSQVLGGDFYLESSEPGKGSVFTAKIKVLAPESSKFVAEESIIFTNANHPKEEPVYKDLSKAKILLVEDSPDNQKLIQIFLAKAGCHITIAANGKSGVEKALNEDFDLILMDIQMPYMDGHEATQILRSKGYQQPIIALTAHAMKEEREKTKVSGFSDFLSKPIQRDVLLEMINRHCR